MSLMYYYGVMGNRATAYVPLSFSLTGATAEDAVLVSAGRNVTAGWRAREDGQLLKKQYNLSSRNSLDWAFGDLDDFDITRYQIQAIWTPGTAFSTLSGDSSPTGTQWQDLITEKAWYLTAINAGNPVSRFGTLQLTIREDGTTTVAGPTNFEITIELIDTV